MIVPPFTIFQNVCVCGGASVCVYVYINNYIHYLLESRINDLAMQPQVFS